MYWIFTTFQKKLEKNTIKLIGNKIIKKFNFIFFTLVITLYSCEIINPEEEIPAYVKITNFKLIDNPEINEGALTHNFSDSWIYIDGKLLGAFEMPFTVPALYKGKHNVIVCPGIKLNGISATRAIYNKCHCYETVAEFFENVDTEIKPETYYYSSLNILFNEDFESIGTIFQKASESDTNICIMNSNNPLINQRYYGAIFLNEKNKKFEAYTNKNYELPKNGTSIFIEMDYNCNQRFIVGIYENQVNQSIQHPLLVVNPQYEWKKIYINLTPIIPKLTKALNFKVFVGAVKDSTIENPYIYIDNIKLLY